MLLRWVPRFEKKVVDAGFIDSTDSGVSIGICCEQSAPCFRKNVSCFLKKSDAIHFWHALVCKQQSHAIVANFQLMEKIERRFRRIACQHAVFGAIVRTQIAFNGPQNIRVVIHAEEYWFCHGPLSAFGTEGSRKNRVKAVRCGSLDLVAGVQEEVRRQKFARLLN